MQKHNISLLLNLLSRSAHVGHCVTQHTKTSRQAAAGLCCIILDQSTSVDPVNATLSMPMCDAIAAPAVGPNPGTILTTPGGKPACQNNMRGNKL